MTHLPPAVHRRIQHCDVKLVRYEADSQKLAWWVYIRNAACSFKCRCSIRVTDESSMRTYECSKAEIGTAVDRKLSHPGQVFTWHFQVSYRRTAAVENLAMMCLETAWYDEKHLQRFAGVRMQRTQIAGQCLQKTSHYSVWKLHYWLLVPTRKSTSVQTGGAIKLTSLKV